METIEAMISLKYVVASLVYSGIGIAILVVCYVLLDVITPKVKIWQELCENKNVALAIFLGAFIIGISLIISSAIHG
jgi:putative membrane protein